MERTLASAERIQREIEARIETQKDILKDHAQIKVQLPDRKEADAGGCNWHATITGDISGHEDVIARAVSEVEGLYNLQ